MRRDEPKRKQSLYFPEDMLDEIAAEARRLDRSLSWIVQSAWKLARNDVFDFPGTDDVREARGDKAPGGGASG